MPRSQLVPCQWGVVCQDLESTYQATDLEQLERCDLFWQATFMFLKRTVCLEQQALVQLHILAVVWTGVVAVAGNWR